MSELAIAIDGPAGAGKSTVAKGIAAKMDIHYLDTGAMYRTLAVAAVDCGVAPGDEPEVRGLLGGVRIEVEYREDGQHMLLNGTDVTGRLRLPEMSMAASTISSHPCVRIYMTELQRDVAKKYDVVMDGRDIGTNVLKDTPYKFYLTAEIGERARRRYEEYLQKGKNDKTLEELQKEIAERDYNDMHRSFMPLRQAEDAVVIDTTHMTAEEVTDAVIREIERKRGA